MHIYIIFCKLNNSRKKATKLTEAMCRINWKFSAEKIKGFYLEIEKEFLLFELQEMIFIIRNYNLILINIKES